MTSVVVFRRCVAFVAIACFLLLVNSAVVQQAAADDWPDWRGPNRDGRSAETGLLQSWPESGPRLERTIKGLGIGYSTPSVADGRIFVMGAADGNEYVHAFGEADGSKIWSTKLGAMGAGGGYRGPRSTPVYDDGFVYALTSKGELASLNAKTGKSRWQINLLKTFAGSPGEWEYSESVLIDGPRLICTPGGGSASVAALDKKSGKAIWKCPADGRAQYSSPIVAGTARNKCYVTFLSDGLVGVDARTGKLLWKYAKSANRTANCSTAVFFDGKILSASGYGTGAGLIELLQTTKKEPFKERYFTRDLANHHGGLVLHEGHVYGTNERSLVCMKFETGEIVWRNRSVGKGSVSLADGRLYVRGENGQVALVVARADKYVEVGRFEQPSRSQEAAWPHPVIANGRLYLRDQDLLLCCNVRAE